MKNHWLANRTERIRKQKLDQQIEQLKLQMMAENPRGMMIPATAKYEKRWQNAGFMTMYGQIIDNDLPKRSITVFDITRARDKMTKIYTEAQLTMTVKSRIINPSIGTLEFMLSNLISAGVDVAFEGWTLKERFAIRKDCLDFVLAKPSLMSLQVVVDMILSRLASYPMRSRRLLKNLPPSRVVSPYVKITDKDFAS